MHGVSKKGGEKCKLFPDMHKLCIIVESALAALGAMLIGLGILALFRWETFIFSQFQKEMVLTPTSRSSSEWISLSIPIVSRIYFWNWTNSDQFGQEGIKPRFEEVGPYVFREKHHKINITWNENGTVSYRWQKFYYFEPDLSNGTLNDVITSVNIARASVSDITHSWNSPLSNFFKSFLFTATDQNVSWTHSVRELTFDGVDNSLLTIGRIASVFAPSSVPDKFGLFYMKNGTVPAEYYNMDTGATNILNIGKVRNINYKNLTAAHKGYCSEMRGSLGEFLQARLDSHSQIVLYAVDLCRPITYYFNGKSVHNNIPVLEFASTPETVDNGAINPENKCFCPQSGNQSSCETSGLFDLRSCKDGAPIFMSFPHMYLAEPKYRDAIEGLKPDPELHRFYIKVEPTTGVPMDIAARFQMNVQIKIDLSPNKSEIILPVFWIETIVALPETHTRDVKLLLQIISLKLYVPITVIIVGATLLLFLSLRKFFKGQGLPLDFFKVKISMTSDVPKEVQLTKVSTISK